MSGETNVLPEGLEAHPQDIEGRLARWVPSVVLCTAIGAGVLWWAMAGRPPHMPPPPMDPGTAYPQPQPTAKPQGGLDGEDVVEVVGDAAETACDVCDCMSGCDCGSIDCGGCDCGGCDGCDLGGLDCGGCDVSCNVANTSSPRVSIQGKTCQRKTSPLRAAGTALSLAAPLFVLGAWRRRRLDPTRRTTQDRPAR